MIGNSNMGGNNDDLCWLLFCSSGNIGYYMLGHDIDGADEKKTDRTLE